MATTRKKITNLHKNLQGSFLSLAPFLLIALAGISTLVIDMGVMRVAHAELQNTTDSAALAAANALSNGIDSATSAANNIISQSSIIGSLDPDNVQITYGTWDSTSSTFTPTNTNANAVQVTASVTSPEFFSSLFSSTKHVLTTTSTASTIGGPRDIVFVVDLTPAMNEYSQLQSINLLSQASIESNLKAIYDALNMPQIGSMQWTPQLLTGSVSKIKTALGLTNGNYPYPGGSWNSYINYVKNDASLAAAGYQNKYGYLTFVNYLLSQEPTASETPLLYQTPEEPLQYVKNAISDFVTNNVTSSDQVALVTYNTTGNNAMVEEHLTTDFSSISSTLNNRQAANYTTTSDLTSAINAAVSELNTNGRQNAQWIIYILSSAQFSNNGNAAIINDATKAATNNIIINTVTIGAQGQESVMSLISQITNGVSAQESASQTDYSQTLADIADQNGKAQIVQ